MNILITGIEGFVGSHLAETLLANPSNKIFGTVFNLSLVHHISHIQHKLQLKQADINNEDDVHKILELSQPDVIYHLAGQAFVPLSYNNPRQTFTTNVIGTLNVLEAFRNYCITLNPHCSALIVSSGEVYGRIADENIPITEDTPMNPTNPYATSKACMDMIAQQYRNSYKLNIIVARPFNHLGPRQSDLFVGSAFAKQLAEIKILSKPPLIRVGNLKPKRDFTDVRDVVTAYVKLTQKPMPHGIYNINSCKSISIQEILDNLIDISNLKVDILEDPNLTRSNDIPDIKTDNSRLTSSTDWLPKIPIRQTLQDLFDYWQNVIQSVK